MSLEAQLLLCCARPKLHREHERQLLMMLDAGVMWAELLTLARRHRMVPLLYQHLTTVAPSALPVDVLDSLRQEFRTNARNSLFLTGALRRILGAFDGNGIRAVAHKGPVLAQLLYGDVALRGMLDLDVFVRRKDVFSAREVLFSLGYRLFAPLTPKKEASILAADSNFVLVHTASKVIVELHWRPESHLSTQVVDRLFGRLQYVSLAGSEVPTFGREELLALLCMHGGRHMWERLEWLAGIAELLRRNEIDWPRLREVAVALGGERALYIGLSLAQGLLRAPLPNGVARSVRSDPAVAELSSAAFEQLFRNHDFTADQLGWPFHRFQLRSRERLGDKVRYACERTIVPAKEDWAALPLPDWLFPLYTLSRPVRITLDYARRRLGAPVPNVKIPLQQ